MGRIIFTWLLCSSALGVFIYLLNMKEKLDTLKIFWRVIVCLVIGAIIAFAPIVLNNIQGI